MSAPNDGGPAFPLVYVDASKHGVRQTVVADGMSLRDYFASHAPEMPKENNSCEVDVYLTPLDRFKKVCAWRYAYADAMLLARLTMPPSTRQTDGGDKL